MNCSSLPDNQTADFIERFFPFTYNQILDNDSGCYDFVNHEYVIWHRSLAEALPLSVQQYGYDSIPNLYTILDTSSLDSAGISRTAEQTFLGNKGRGALIGIVDTGIDYTNPLLRNPDGSTRIAAIWDQTVPGAGLSTPDPIDALHYGSVYQRSHINEALRSEDPHSIVPTSDPLRHGTQMALVAAGSEDADAFFSGAAPESELVVVRLKPARTYLRDFFLIREDAIAFQEDDIMLGIKFLLYIARQEKKPLVILLGLGTNTGSHSGTSPLGLYLNRLSRASGQILVAAGGNETGRGHHFRSVFPASTSYEDVELRVGPDERGFTLELWARESELYSVGFLSPSGDETGRIRLSGDEERRIPFLLEGTTIHLNYTSSELATGSELILMRFDAPAAGIWKIRVYHTLSIQGEYHMWLPVHGFISDETFFLRPDPDTTITDPGNTAAIITTAAYSHQTGGIYLHSSRGFTRTRTIKPDLAAPGVRLPLPDYQEVTGTSFAAAMTAGAAAILLSWSAYTPSAPRINTSIAKAFLIRGADRRNSIEYPSREWGYGTLNLYNSFLSMRS